MENYPFYTDYEMPYEKNWCDSVKSTDLEFGLIFDTILALVLISYVMLLYLILLSYKMEIISFLNFSGN